jgi:hypothetical protein
MNKRQDELQGSGEHSGVQGESQSEKGRPGILHIVSFELNDKNLLSDWKKMSDGITISLKNAPGFISRESALKKDGKIYCVLFWENMTAQEAVKKMLESPEMAEEMKAFAVIANLETMKEDFLEII